MVPPSNIDELRSLAQRLDNLLGDPHPGLWSWQEAVCRLIKEIAEFGGYK